MNYREAWANGDIEAGTLVDAIEEQAREIDSLKSALLVSQRSAVNIATELRADIASKQLTIDGMNEAHWKVVQELAALKAQHEQDAQTIKVLQAMARQLKAQPIGVVLPERRDFSPQSDSEWGWNACLDEVARLNSSPVSAGDPEKCSYQDDPRSPAELSLAGCNCVRFGESNPHWPCKLHTPVSAGDDRETIRAVFLRNGFTIKEGQADLKPYVYAAAGELMSIARAALSAPSHGDQVREGWQLVPVEPIDAMLEAGDKYTGTPATYKAMLSACPSPPITKDFSQFLSAVMDAAGLIRHGRQSKELSEYLGMKCMEYRGVAPSAGSQGGDV